MRNIRLPFYFMILSGLFGAALSYCILKYGLHIETTNAQTDANNIMPNENCQMTIGRLAGYEHIKPLLLVEPECESGALEQIKEHAKQLIEEKKQSGKLITASIYVKAISKNMWTSVNVDERYHPASLNKVPILITFMRMNEKHSGLLDQKYTYIKGSLVFPKQYYPSKELQDGQSYSVRELLKYMICYSDNAATTLLWNHMDFKEYANTFTNLGLQKPSFKFDEMELSVHEYCNFFKILYNATYLSRESSEFCFSLLTHTDFNEGLVKQLPAQVMVAHKFGECNYDIVNKAGEKPIGTLNELHDAGIVYLGDKAYYVTIMTKGTDTQFLASVISELSATIYSDINKMNLL